MKSIVEYDLLFDLDGTLVETDHLYVIVWSKLLKKYGLHVDVEFFNYYIKGKSDISFLKEIVPNLSDNCIIQISKLKDTLFNEELAKNKTDILVEGAYQFINNHQNSKIAIVTNCNRSAALEILKITKLDKFINLVIASEDVTKHKPDVMPYKKAIKTLELNPENTIIFEDSTSGYKSARQIKNAKLCLITNDRSSSDMLDAQEYKINNYNDFNFQKLKEINTRVEDNIHSTISESLDFLPINKILNNDVNLKTGFICDILSYQILFQNGESEPIVIKLSNSDNELSDTAKKLNLYQNEITFYKDISHLINLKIPKYYKEIYFKDKNGIILENLSKYNGQFNIDLNNNINLILDIIKVVSSMHNKFVFNSQEEIIHCMLKLNKVNQIVYYQELINTRFDYFLKKNKLLLSDYEILMLNTIYKNFKTITDTASKFPLNFCHGDLKSPNIFYKNNNEPIFLDWQYIHLNKGISDITFLMIESINFDPIVSNLILQYYYLNTPQYSTFEELLYDFRLSLCIFPFFVSVWFNSELTENLLDSIFPIKFMKNMLKYYHYYLDINFFYKLKKYYLGASILSCDLLNIYNESSRVLESGCDFLHIDIMDGHFVDNIAIGLDTLIQLRNKMKSVYFDVHLMVKNPYSWIKKLLNLNINSISFHIESDTQIIKALKLIKNNNAKAGLAINPDTKIEKLYDYISYIDYVLFMTVNPGFSGQTFDASVIDKIRIFHEKFPNIIIEVDGGINNENIKLLSDIGITTFVSGSTIFKSMDYKNTIKELKSKFSM